MIGSIAGNEDSTAVKASPVLMELVLPWKRDTRCSVVGFLCSGEGRRMSGNGFVERVNHQRLSRDLPLKLRPKGGRKKQARQPCVGWEWAAEAVERP